MSDIGRPIYGHVMGALMLDTRFPRPVGDIGNALTWPFPMLYRVVNGAVPSEVLNADDTTWLEPFLVAARELVRDGVQAITTSCGYLAIYQRELAAELPVPVLTSALLQVPFAAELIGRTRKVGILTVRDMLTEQHFNGVGWSSASTPVAVRAVDPSSRFARIYAPLDPQEAPPEATPEQLTDEVVGAALRLVTDEPSVGVIVMECTNLVPYSHAVRRATGLPVLDHYSLVMNTYQALCGTHF